MAIFASTYLLKVISPEDVAGRRKEGFSLLDLQRVAQKRGYKAQAFRLQASDLPKLNGPAIVFIEPDGYKHFAVLRGVRADRVFMADPSRGNVRMPAYQFLQAWQGGDGTGIIFVVEPQADTQAKSAMPLSLGPDLAAQPEILSARELLAIRAASVPPPQTYRYKDMRLPTIGALACLAMCGTALAASDAARPVEVSALDQAKEEPAALTLGRSGCAAPRRCRDRQQTGRVQSDPGTANRH